MKMRVLVSHYVTMEVDTDDLDKGCDQIQKAVIEEDSRLEWEKPSLDYPEVVSNDTGTVKFPRGGSCFI